MRQPPRFGPAAKIARIDIDPAEIGTAARYVDIPIVGDCKAVLGQLLQGIKGRDQSGQVCRLAQAAGGWRGGQAVRRRRQQAARGRRHPSGPHAGGGARLHEARRHPVRRRAGDAELRPPDDADVLAGPSFELRSVRHHGRRPAVRRRRQGRLPGQAGDRRAWRRLAWA